MPGPLSSILLLYLFVLRSTHIGLESHFLSDTLIRYYEWTFFVIVNIMYLAGLSGFIKNS